METNFSEFFIGIQTFLFKKMHLKMSSAQWYPFVLAPSMPQASYDPLVLKHHQEQCWLQSYTYIYQVFGCQTFQITFVDLMMSFKLIGKI